MFSIMLRIHRTKHKTKYRNCSSEWPARWPSTRPDDKMITSDNKTIVTVDKMTTVIDKIIVVVNNLVIRSAIWSVVWMNSLCLVLYLVLCVHIIIVFFFLPHILVKKLLKKSFPKWALYKHDSSKGLILRRHHKFNSP